MYLIVILNNNEIEFNIKLHDAYMKDVVYIYIYIYMCVCVCIHIYIYIYIYPHDTGLQRIHKFNVTLNCTTYFFFIYLYLN